MFFTSPDRRLLDISVSNTTTFGGQEFARPDATEMRPYQRNHEPLLCLKSRRHDYFTTLWKQKRLTLTNGRKERADGKTEGGALGIMPVYRKGALLAIYVQSGPKGWKRGRDGSVCEYDRTSSAERYYFRRGMDTISLVGTATLWVADVAMPGCWLEKSSDPAKLRVSELLPQAK